MLSIPHSNVFEFNIIPKSKKQIINFLSVLILLYLMQIYFNLVVIILVVFSLLSHELGHYFALKALKIKVHKVHISLYSNNYIKYGDIKSPIKGIFKTISGPLFGIIFPSFILIGINIFSSVSTYTIINSILLISIIQFLNFLPLKRNTDGDQLISYMREL